MSQDESKPFFDASSIAPGNPAPPATSPSPAPQGPQPPAAPPAEASRPGPPPPPPSGIDLSAPPTSFVPGKAPAIDPLKDVPTEFVKVQRGHLPPEELAAKREETSAARERLKEEANESFTVIREAKGRVAIEVQRMAAAEIESAFATIKIVMAKGTGRDRLSAAGTILERAAGRSGSFLELHCDLSRMKPADAIDAVMGEMGKGHISVQDAQSVVNMIKLRSDVTEQTEMLKRIAALETYLASNAATKLAKADPDQALGDFMPIRTPSKSAMPN